MQEDSGGKVARGKTRHGSDRERPAAERLVRETVGKSTEESEAGQRRGRSVGERLRSEEPV